jgi:aspartyl aminopeptidase
MNRSANDGAVYNAQTDMQPLLGSEIAADSLMPLLAECCGVRREDITGTDLFLYCRQSGTIVGIENEYICSPRLDDLMCSYINLRSFIESSNPGLVPMCCIFDNEEVGSGTKQGADSTFLSDTIARINLSAGRNAEQLFTSLAGSFMVSADNAHAIHPNHPEKYDRDNSCYMNKGVVIKFNAAQKYTSDAVSSAVFKAVCRRAGVPFQTYLNRSDVAGGSTLGNISNSHISINTVDIGLAQLAMHSCYETAGAKDAEYLLKAMKTFFSMDYRCGDGEYSIG